MLYTSHINGQSGLASASASGAQTTQPETGDQDFLAKLLGLTATDGIDTVGQTSSSSVSKLGKSPLLNAGGTEDSPLSEADRKERTAWNMIFPGLSPTGASPGQIGQNIKSNKELARVKTLEVDGALKSAAPLQPKLEKAKDEKEVADVSIDKVITTLTSDSKVPTGDAKPVASSELLNTSLPSTENPQSQQTATQKYAKALFEGSASKAPKPNDKNLKVDKNGKANELVSEKYADAAADVNKNVNVTVADKSQKGLSSSKSTVNEPTVQVKKENSSESKVDEKMSSRKHFNSDSISADNFVLQQKSHAGSDAASINHAETRTTVPELMGKVESMVKQGGGKITVTLSPPHLGSLEVRVTTKGKNVEIEMLSASHEAKSMLQSKLHDLKSSLQSHSLSLTKVEVHVGRDVSTRSGDGFSNNGQSFQSESQAFTSQQNESQSQNRSRSDSDPFFARRSDSFSSVSTSSAPMGRAASQHAGSVDLRI